MRSPSSRPTAPATRLDAVPPAVVASVEPRLLRVPLPSFMTAFGYRDINVVLVAVRSTDGATGTGFAYTLDTGAPVVVRMVDAVVAPAAEGRDLAAWEAVAESVRAQTRRLGATAFTAALSAVDIAVWDLRGKLAAQPIARLLGGEPRAVRIYGSGRSGQAFSTAELVDHSLAYLTDGYAGVKVAIGAHPIEVDVARVRAVREAIGDAVPLMVDASERYSLAAAVEFARKAAELGLEWFEEPLLAEDVSGYRALATMSRIPIATGEHLQGLAQFERYLAETGVALYQPDVALGGGIGMLHQAAGMMAGHGRAIGWHSLADLHAHLAGANPATAWLEDFPILDRILADPLRPAEGVVAAPARPGHGIAWDDDAVAAFEQK